VDGAADLPAAHAVQDALVLHGPKTAPPPPYTTRHAEWRDYFTSAQQLLVADPPPASDRRILNAIAPLGLDARGGFDPRRFNAAEIEEIKTGIADARAMVGKGEPPVVVQGWTYPRAEVGNFGQNYALRASTALLGLAALPRDEAMYMRPVGEDGRVVMRGDGLYRLRFAKDQFPPVDGFWSLTMYELTPEGQAFLTPNPINRYSIGDRTPGLKRNDDGSLEIWISRAAPAEDRRANWLPAPASGPYRMTLRTYLPRPEMREGRWRLPALEKV
jgi:hypothetical protein